MAVGAGRQADMVVCVCVCVCVRVCCYFAHVGRSMKC